MIDKINRWKNSKGLFISADYETKDGLTSAKGILKEVYDDGSVLVVHISNENVSWEFNINQVVSHSFSEVRR